MNIVSHMFKKAISKIFPKPKMLSLPPKLKHIPHNLEKEYTMDHSIPVSYWYKDDSYSDNNPIVYTTEQINALINEAKQKKTRHYKKTDLYLYKGIEQYLSFIKNKEVAILGSVSPWYESIILSYGGKPTTIEYNKIKSLDKRLTTMTVKEYEENPKKFDVILSISSFEHDGLGRYGDPLNPNGDLQAMSNTKKMLKDNGLLFLAVPVGKDCLVWNAQRIYGKRRLPLLLNGWKILKSIGFSKIDFYKGDLLNGNHQPIFILSLKK